jgi:hypothetical protein
MLSNVDSLQVPRRTWFAIFIAGFFWLFFLILRSNNYTNQDGALRCIAVFFGGIQFHSNNHMLYPFWISAWARANELVGIRASDAFQYMRISEAMDAFAGAASIGCLYQLITSIAGWKSALFGSLLFGFSGALGLQATGSAEAIPGLLFALVASVVLAAGIWRSNAILLFLAGVVMAVAPATYEAMGTVAGTGALMCCFWPSLRPQPRGMVPVVRRLAIVGLGGLAGVFGIYSWAYASQGIPWKKMPSQFFALGGAPEVYAGLDLLKSKVPNVFMGLIAWSFRAVLENYGSIRVLLHHPQRWFWLPVVVCAFSLMAVIFVMTAQRWRVLARPLTPFKLGAVLGAALVVGFPLYYWGPLNPKLWIFPLAVLIFAATVGWRPGLAGSGAAYKVLTACLLICMTAEIATNVPNLFRDHVEPTPYLDEAGEVAATLSPDDWIVADFDEISQLWMAFWGYKANVLLLPASTRTEASQWLEKAKASCRQGRGRIVFLNVLHMSRRTWDDFIGARVQIAYELLDEYRERGTLLKSFNRYGPTIEVWQFTPAR